jgi:hypothetical protein
VPWDNSPEKRRRDTQTYGSPEYRRNRELARRRANGTCEQCGHRHQRLECDHIIPTTQGGTHALSNLRMICKGYGTCKCHERKSAQEGRGYRAKKETRDPSPTPRTRF